MARNDLPNKLTAMIERDHGMRYYSRVPRKVKPGYILVHNQIIHTKDMPSGVCGFRFWTQKPEPGWVRCKCGWQGVSHYCARGDENRKCAPGAWQEHESVWIIKYERRRRAEMRTKR
jgi:hypothetical protein